VHTHARVALDCAAGLITLGGLCDVFTPRLPPNLLTVSNGDPRTEKALRELLRALGGCLVAAGITVAALVNGSGFRDQGSTAGLVLLLVLPSEGINAFAMYRAGSPFLIPLAFVAITLIGVALG